MRENTARERFWVRNLFRHRILRNDLSAKQAGLFTRKQDSKHANQNSQNASTPPNKAKSLAHTEQSEIISTTPTHLKQTLPPHLSKLDQFC
jgi:hypothetical protein